MALYCLCIAKWMRRRYARIMRRNRIPKAHAGAFKTTPLLDGSKRATYSILRRSRRKASGGHSDGGRVKTHHRARVEQLEAR